MKRPAAAKRTSAPPGESGQPDPESAPSKPRPKRKPKAPDADADTGAEGDHTKSNAPDASASKEPPKKKSRGSQAASADQDVPARKTFAKRSYPPKEGPGREKWVALREDEFWKFFTTWTCGDQTLTAASAATIKALLVMATKCSLIWSEQSDAIGHRQVPENPDAIDLRVLPVNLWDNRILLLASENFQNNLIPLVPENAAERAAALDEPMFPVITIPDSDGGHPDVRALVPVPTPKPGKGKGGQCAEGKGKGFGGGGAESSAADRPSNMIWAEGPDEGPMLAVEMTFDDESYDMTFEAPEPPQELPVITEGAIFKRMWRMFRPRQDGSYLVPESMVKEYQNKLTRPTVVRAFERCGYHVEKFIKKVNKTLENVEEVEIEEDWEFLTDEGCQLAREPCFKQKTHRSIIRRMMEAEEEGDIEDKDLAMDWGKMEMQGSDSSAPAGGANQGPSLDGVDKKTLQCFPDLEKATASSIAKNVRAARSEGHEALGGQFPRAMAEGNASRDVHDMLSTFNLGLRVPRECITYAVDTGEAPIHLPWIRPSQWVSYLVATHPEAMFGTTTQVGDQLQAFWECYRESHPGHQVFASSRLRRTIPLLLHGDEGRYLKRSNYLITTVESCLGRPASKMQCCTCKADPVLSRYNDLDVEPHPKRARASKQHCNSTGHPYLSKFLCCGMATKEYKEHPELMFEAFRLLAEDLEDLCSNGVEIHGHGRFYGGFLGLKGDMAFHHKIGHLTRSYRNLGKERDLAMCHLCNAGEEHVPFESVEDTPAWEDTFCVSEPWPEDDPPDLSSIPFDPLCRPAMFRLDVFHLWKVGLGRDLVGSGVADLQPTGEGMFHGVHGKQQVARSYGDSVAASSFKMPRWGHLSQRARLRQTGDMVAHVLSSEIMNERGVQEFFSRPEAVSHEESRSV
eukprot:s1931_g2.t1